jgi:AraC family transcriptional regulator, regulatory protein of adaptative response / methylated-DNA-[protein]-cysteine methyltransferase
MPQLRFARVDSSLGPMLVAETDAGIAAVTRADAVEPFLERLRQRFPDTEPVPAELDAAWLDDALSGGPLPPVDLRGLSRFVGRVYEVVRSLRPGETATYGEVAALAGSPGAARAVGNAMARCPLFPAVPCHRVVRASDGWSGWGGNPALKRRLLESERTRRGNWPKRQESHEVIATRPLGPSDRQDSREA